MKHFLFVNLELLRSTSQAILERKIDNGIGQAVQNLCR